MPAQMPDKSQTCYYRLLSKKDVAEMVGCTERTVDRMVARREIPFTRIPWGNRGRFKRRFIFGAIAEWIEHHATRCQYPDDTEDRQEIDHE